MRREPPMERGTSALGVGPRPAVRATQMRGLASLQGKSRSNPEAARRRGENILKGQVVP